MKKILLPICAMLLCMTACKKDEGVLKLEIERYNTNAKVHINAGDEYTRYAVWDNNDKIWLNGAEATVSISGNRGTIAIPESVAGATSYTAIYPYDWVEDTYMGLSIKYQTQYYRRSNDNARQIVDAPMIAVSDGGTLRFHNLGSILALSVSNYNDPITVTKIEVSSDGNGALMVGGNYLLNDLGFERVITGTESGTITLDCSSDPVEISYGMETFYIALPPILTATLTIRVYDNSGYYERSQTANVLYAQNTINHGIFMIDESVYHSEGGGGDVPVPASNQIWVKTNAEPWEQIDWMSYGYLGIPRYDEESGYYIFEFQEHELMTMDNTEGNWNWLTNNVRITSIIIPAGVQNMENVSFEGDMSLTDMAIYSSNVNPDHNIRFGSNTSGTLHLVQPWRPEEEVRMEWQNTGWQGEIVFDLPSSEGPEGPMP